MQVSVSCDDRICCDEELIQRVEGVVAGTLGSLMDCVARVDVYLSDLNGHHLGDPDQKCQMEARIGGLAPVIVSHAAATLAEAIHDAANRLKRLLGKQLRHFEQSQSEFDSKARPVVGQGPIGPDGSIGQGG
jgi:hypothetical protein